jgi:hypothetical protein
LAGATASPSMIADPVQICHASSAIFLNRVVQSTAPGVDLQEMDLNAIAIEFDFVEPTVAAGHLVDGARERRFEEVRKGSLDADDRRLFPLKRHHLRSIGITSSTSDLVVLLRTFS